jgi:hypothetical protein
LTKSGLGYLGRDHGIAPALALPVARLVAQIFKEASAALALVVAHPEGNQAGEAKSDIWSAVAAAAEVSL